MANLKNASIREMVIDKCLSDRKRKYSTRDIMEACNKALEFEGYGPVTSLNTIRGDMQAIENRWHAYGGEIMEERCGRNKYYYYKKEGFSIYQAGLTEEELSKLNATINLLGKFKGIPQFEWISELTTRFRSTFMASSNKNCFISFDDSEESEGIQHLTTLFDAISDKQVIEILYKPFGREKGSIRIIHPYYLKEYNNRWFLFGLDKEYNSLSTMALDRIRNISESKDQYIENNTWDFNHYFDNVIGVSVDNEKPILQIQIWVSANLYNYLRTKPLHKSQKLLKKRSDGDKVIQIDVKENYELYQKLLSLGENAIVISPAHIRKKMQEHLCFASENYAKKQD